MRITSKYAGKCKTCNSRYEVGADIEWTREGGVTACTACPGGAAAQNTPAPAPIDVAANLVALRARLNAEQQALAAWRPAQGNVRAVAAAGSGKTTTTVALVANLLEEGILPRQVVVTTFTNKAGRELRDRLAQVITPAKLADLRVGTFHSLATRALRGDPRFAMNKNVEGSAGNRDKAIPSARVMWNRACGTGNIQVLGEFGAGAGDDAAKAYPLAIEANCRSKGLTWDSDEGRAACEATNLPQLHTVWSLYERQKKACGGFDFHDLLVAYYEVVRTNPSNAVVIVDEAQDNSLMQVAIAQALAGEHGRIVLVGDVRQSIYEWRGASPGLFLTADQTIGASTLYLRTNYRSGRRIVELGNRVAEGRSWSLGPASEAGRDSDGQVAVVGHPESIDEATAVSKEIAEMVTGGIQPDDIAVLCRTRAQQGGYEAALLARKIPVAIVGGSSFFAGAEWKDFSATLAVLAGAADAAAVGRFVGLVPGCGYFSAQAAEKGFAAAGTVAGAIEFAVADARRGDIKAALREALVWVKGLQAQPLKEQAIRAAEWLVAGCPESESGDDDRRGSLLAAAAIAGRFQTYAKAAAFATACDGAAQAVLDREDGQPIRGRVSISTIHKAKGREWGTVFVSATDGQFPHHRSLGDKARAEEEARLFYVAVTRAKDNLRLTYADTMFDRPAGPSPFLDFVEQPVKPVPPGPQGGGDGPVKATLAQVEADLLDVAIKHHGDEAVIEALASGELTLSRPTEHDLDDEPAPSAAALRAALEADAPRAEALTAQGVQPVPGSRFVPVTWSEFTALLAPHGFSEGHPNGQRVLQAYLADGSTVRVYSTVPMGEDEARGLGEDSIKVSLVSPEDRPFSKRLPYAARTRNWRVTLLTRLVTVLGSHPSLRQEAQ